MLIFQRIFFAAVLAGLVAGLAMSAIQHWRVTPLIHAAETYEVAAPADHDHAEGTPAHSHDPQAWAPANGPERIGYTVLANVLASLGFALLLGGISALAGIEITAQNGVIWGLCGFIAFQLAPAFGLPPELPGMPAADLGARQLWWWSTALGTGAGLLAVAKLRNWGGVAIAAVLILAPHVIGAPQPSDVEPSAVPAHLATAFAAASLGVGAIFWLTVGPLMGWIMSRRAAPGTGLKGARA